MGYNSGKKTILFFFIFLPLFFSERTPVRSGQPHRGSFMRQVAADNACARWCIVVTPLGIARYRSRSVIYRGHSQCVTKPVCSHYSVSRSTPAFTVYPWFLLYLPYVVYLFILMLFLEWIQFLHIWIFLRSTAVFVHICQIFPISTCNIGDTDNWRPGGTGV